MIWYDAYEYDFNDIHGEVVVHKDHDLKIGDEVILYSVEGNVHDADYEGFAAIVTVVGFLSAANSEYVRVRTSLRR